jgi:predicted lipid-binding transport protein (Tim44 family)
VNISLSNEMAWLWILGCWIVAGLWLWTRWGKYKRAGAGYVYGRSTTQSEDSLFNTWSSIPHAVDTAFINTKHTVSIHKEFDPKGEIKEAHRSGSILPDHPAFLNAAKQYFLALQAAFDKGELDSFRDWMMPEMHADLVEQIQERQGAFSQTEVLTLNALIMDERVEEGTNWVTVKFNGTTRDHPNLNVITFNEAWHFTQSCFSSNDPWRLAGIDPIQ